MIWQKFFLVLLCKQEGFTKINRSVRNRDAMNNKVAAISKMMELPGDK